MKSLKFHARVWQWPGDAGWHFVTIPRDLYEYIRATYPRGMVHVVATLGKTSWDTALFPHTRDHSYILPIKKSVRKREDVWTGDEVEIRIKKK